MAFLSERSKFVYNALLEEDEIADRLIDKGVRVVKLNRGDPAVYFKTPKYIIDAYVKALRESKTYYSKAQGSAELAHAVQKRYQSMYRVDFHDDSVIATEGLSEALLFINSALINRGDIAVIFKPYYNQYMTQLKIEGGIPSMADYKESKKWDMDPDAVRKMLAKLKLDRKLNRVKYMLITNPNNPTGTVLGRRALKEIVEIAKDFGIMLISDEIYDEIVYNGAEFTSLAKLAIGVPHVILNGMSKDYDSTGFRIGFAIIPESDRNSHSLRSKLVDYARVRLSLNTPAMYAAAEAIGNIKEHKKAITQMTGEIEKRVNHSMKILEGNSFVKTIMPNGAFYILPRIDLKALRMKNDSEFVQKLLLEEGIQVTRGSGFGAESHFRIVSLAPKGILDYSINKINDFCIRHARK